MNSTWWSSSPHVWGRGKVPPHLGWKRNRTEKLKSCPSSPPLPPFPFDSAAMQKANEVRGGNGARRTCIPRIRAKIIQREERKTEIQKKILTVVQNPEHVWGGGGGGEEREKKCFFSFSSFFSHSLTCSLHSSSVGAKGRGGGGGHLLGLFFRRRTEEAERRKRGEKKEFSKAFTLPKRVIQSWIKKVPCPEN